MRKLILAACGLLVSAGLSSAQTIAQWTFEGTAISSTTAYSYMYGSPEIGSGTALGMHGFTNTVWSSPAGDGSAHSFSANTWAQGDYWQFSVNLDQANNTYANLGVSFDQNGSTTGPKSYYLAYSTDGSSFTQLGADYALASGVTWSATSPGLGTHESFDLSSLTALNTASTVYFRIVDDSSTTAGAINGGNVSSSGTDRVDNFTVTGLVTPVPEPTALALVGLGCATLLAVRRRS